MAIKEETYSRPCPVHGQLLTTKRTKTIRTKSGERYTKPFFYCSKCKAYYLIVDEFASDFKQKSLADSGTPIYILGKQKENKIKVEEKQPIKAINHNKYTIEDEILKITVIPRGTKLPKKCPNCQKDTHMLAFKATAMGKVIKVLQGKRCSCCDINFFPEELYKQNSEYFVITGQKKDVSKEKELISLYLVAKDKASRKIIKEQLLNIEDDISDDFLEKINQLDGENKEKLLILAVMKEPQTFLEQVVNQYGNDTAEFYRITKHIDFKEEKYQEAALNFIREVEPHPLLLVKIKEHAVDRLFDTDLQKIILKHSINKEDWSKYIPYININSLDGIEFLNGFSDMAVLNYIYDKNLQEIEERYIEKLSDVAKEVWFLRNTQDDSVIISAIDYVEQQIKSFGNLPRTISGGEDYLKMFLELAMLIKDEQLMDQIYLELVNAGINVGKKYEKYFMTMKSKALLNVLLERISIADLTEKHKTAKNILANYPESIHDLKFAVEATGIQKFIDNVMKMAEDLNIAWPTIIEEDLCEFRILEDGEKLPSRCLECGHETVIYRHETYSKGKIKKIPGRQCEQCKTCFFTNKVYKAHEEAFEKLVVVKNDSAVGLGENKIGTEETKGSSKSEKTEEVTLYTESMGTPQVEELINEEADGRNDFNSQNANVDGWKSKKKKYENVYNGPEAYLEAYQVKKCIVCGRPLNGDADTAWVQCNKCKAIYCEESYKHIFSEPVIIIGKRK